jgi:hypothetical protein
MGIYAGLPAKTQTSGSDKGHSAQGIARAKASSVRAYLDRKPSYTKAV